MATVQDQFSRMMEKFVIACWPTYGAEGASTTFDWYRRATTGPIDDLGQPTNAWTLQEAAVPCTWVGIKEEDEGGFEIPPQGQTQHPIYEAYCDFRDIVAGDNILIALDGRVYNVERSERQGPLIALLLDHGTAQLEP